MPPLPFLSIVFLYNTLRIRANFATLRIDQEVQGESSRQLVGYGIEDVNHELYGGLYSQLVYGEDFEEPPGTSGVSGDFALGDEVGRIDMGATAPAPLSPTWVALPQRDRRAVLGRRPESPAYETVSSGVFNGKQAQLLTSDGSLTPAQILNRGLYQQGMYFERGRAYEGFVYARVSHAFSADSPPRLSVALVSMGCNANASASDVKAQAAFNTLASVNFSLQDDGTWHRLDFKLQTQSMGAKCHVIASGKKQSHCKATVEGECVVCDGSFLLSVLSGSVVLDFVFLQAGEWGRFESLPVRKDVAMSMLSTGINVLRLGGSMCNVDGYRWKNMRGPRERRQPYMGLWHPFASQGWRVFEFLDLCEKLGVQAVVTLNSDETAEDLADLVEYAYGGADTAWGKRRIEDGQHPHPYAPFVVEIGNEQPLSYQLIRAVAEGTEAMRLKAQVIRLKPRSLRFAIGVNIDMAEINTPLCDAMVNATKFLGDTIMWDLHVDGQDPVAEDHWSSTFTMALSMLDRLGSKMKIAVLEENAMTHTLIRGLNRARYANAYARLADRFALATAANGLQVFGFNDNGWDQGAIFMTPDRVWLSPYGYVDHMVSRASERLVLRASLEPQATREPLNDMLDILATTSEDNSTYVLRVVNYGRDGKLNLTIRLPQQVRCGLATLTKLEVPAGDSPSSVNPPSNTTHISPEKVEVTQLDSVMVAPLSLTTVRWRDCCIVTNLTAANLMVRYV